MTLEEKEQLTFDIFTLAEVPPDEDAIESFLEELEDPVFATQARRWVMEYQANEVFAHTNGSLDSRFVYPDAIMALKPTIGFDLLWHWIKERHRIWLARMNNEPAPWTDDPNIATYKYCNVIRDLDTESLTCQKIANSGPSLISFPEQALRTLAFKQFNWTPTFEAWENGLKTKLCIANFDIARLEELTPRGKHYSAAYNISPPNASNIVKAGLPPNTSPVRYHLWVVEQMHKKGIFEKIGDTKDLGQVYRILIKQPRINTLKGSQMTMDLNYGPWLKHSIWEFCICGPGAVDGITKCFHNPQGYSPEYITRLVTEGQDECSLIAVGAPAPKFNGYPLYPMAIQNAFCDNGKHTRLAAPQLEVLLKKPSKKPKERYYVEDGEHKPFKEEQLLPWFYQ
jgi:hypothetical protein